MKKLIDVWTAARSAMLAGALGCGPLLAHAASAPDPGDYVPAPAGASVLAIYAQRLTADKVYDGGDRVGGDLGLKLDVGILRGMHYFELGGKPADVEVILPFGRQRVDSIDYRESGIGNLIVGATLWTLSDEASGQHLGFAGYLSLPSGQKRSKGLFVSEDRYALDLQAGYIRKLAEQWSLDLIGQTELYTRDDTSDVKRKPLLRGYVHLSYLLSPQTRLAFSVRQSLGAKETLNGTTVLGAKNDTNLMLTWAYSFTDSVNLQLQYADDVRVRNGPAIKGWQARLAIVF